MWRSYGDTVRDMGIHSIPLFVFSLEANGGPFREGVGATFTHGGSGSPEAFDQLFQRAWAAAADARRTRGPTRHTRTKRRRVLWGPGDLSSNPKCRAFDSVFAVSTPRGPRT